MLENSITSFKSALNSLTRRLFPEEWATWQRSLGDAYYNNAFTITEDDLEDSSIRERIAENIERAIAAYTSALEVYTYTSFPVDWATLQHKLGDAYSCRILGDAAENIESMIAAYTAALRVLTRSTFLVDWISLQTNLGLAYGNRILGDRAENIERAIDAFTVIRDQVNFSNAPKIGAMNQTNLGLAYRNRILGDRAKNIESAIAAFNAALQILTRSAFPQEWAIVQDNLGSAYYYRILGDKAKNIESAIAAFNAALEIRTRSASSLGWAMTQNNLGMAYYERALYESLNDLNRFSPIFRWFQQQIPLALFFSRDRISEKSASASAKDMESAIAAYTAALEVITRSVFPRQYAAIQMNLGNAYAFRTSGTRAKNIESAIAAFNAVLEIHTRSAFPREYAHILFNLGCLYQGAKQFDSAYNAFAEAIEIVESLRGEIISGDENKRKQAEEYNKFYICIVEACLELGNIIAAIEYVERSKTRNLVELILDRDSKNIYPPKLVIQLEKIRDEIANNQCQLQNGKAKNPTVLSQHLRELRKQRQILQDSYLPVGFGFRFEQFKENLDKRTAIIEWYITTDRIIAFIIKRHGQELIFWQSQSEDLNALFDWANEYLNAYYDPQDESKIQWKNQLEERLKKLANILHIEEILAQLPKQCERLILIPHRFLHLFPLHALPVKESYLIDLFPNGVGYAPSCQLLEQLQLRQRPDFKSLLAIQDPEKNLYYADLEVQVIKSYFSTANILKESAATLTAVNNSDFNTYHCTHFSCHGYFNLRNPSKSALILANASIADTPKDSGSERYLNLRAGENHDLEKCLTLDKIFTLKLEKCRLVTLSACETGLIDPSSTSDEYIGLPSGFLLAGSQAIVSSLWSVNDLSTALLMIKFYETLQTQTSVVIALNQAQQWLRNLTIEEFERVLELYKPQIEETLAQMRPGPRLVFQEQLKLKRQGQSLPFANPHYWAAFTAIGV